MKSGKLNLMVSLLDAGLENNIHPPYRRTAGERLAGADRKFHKATAKIKGKSVIVSSDEVPDPVAARYAFENFVEGHLYNLYGLPASSFRTDDWVDNEE